MHVYHSSFDLVEVRVAPVVRFTASAKKSTSKLQAEQEEERERER